MKTTASGPLQTATSPDREGEQASERADASIKAGADTLLRRASEAKHALPSTGTIAAPAFAAPPDLSSVGGLRLGQLLLGATVGLVVVLVTALTLLSNASTAHQFNLTAQGYTLRLQAQARELGLAVSRTLSVTSASALRDNDYAVLASAVRAIVASNENVLRVQVLDADQVLVADSDAQAPLGQALPRPVTSSLSSNTYGGRPVYEYQEPIDYGSSRGKGLAILSYSLAPLQRQLAELEQAKRATLRGASRRSVGLGAVVLLVAALLAAFESRRVTRPLEELDRSVSRLSAGDLRARVTVPRSGAREVRALSVLFNHMADRIAWLLEDVRVKAALQREMSLARTVQETLQPSVEPRQLGPLRVAGRCLTADACGGDWWQCAPLGPDRVVVAVGDVTGHGLPAALVASSAATAFASALTLYAPESLSVELLIHALNRLLFQVARGEHQMSAVIAIVDTKQGTLQYAAGAHPPALLANRHDRRTHRLSAKGALLGSSPGSVFAVQSQPLASGDVLLWFTDGLTEAVDSEGKAYGLNRLSATLVKNLDLPVEQLREAILTDIRTHTGGAPLADDHTLVVSSYEPKATRPS